MGVPQQRQTQHSIPRPVSCPRAGHVLVRLVGRLCEIIQQEEREVARTGGAQIQVVQARRCEDGGAGHHYRLTLLKQQRHLRLNGDVSLLRPDRDPVPARVVKTLGRHVWVLTQDLGEDLSRLTLRSDADWLWAAVRYRLRELWPPVERRPRGAVAPQHALILDLLNARPRKRSHAVSAGTSEAGLNREQRGAVRAILANAVTFVWGPPGTGKTRTVSHAVADLVAADRTVLVVAPSNAAADVIAARIAERLSSHADFDTGLVVRHGPGTGPRLRSEWGDRLVPDEIAQRLQRESAYTCGGNSQRHAARAASLEGALAGLTSQSRIATCPRLAETGRRVVRSLRLRANAQHSSVPVRTSPDLVTGAAAVVVTTIHQLCFQSAAVRMYDTVIVDEAGQASLPLILLSAAHGREAIVVAGDPRQLPPPVQARDARVKRLLGEDVFTLSGAIARAASGATSMLVEQHRMAPEICSVVSDVWYEGKLRPHGSVLARPEHPVRRAHGSFVLVDTHGLHPRVTRTKGRSRVNSAHVEVVRQLVGQLEADKLLPRSTTLLVMSPFKAQISRLAGAIRRFSASTVHSAQGGEADLVVLDLTDAPGAGVSAFLSAEDIAEEGARLLNVAVSRARYTVFVVADVPHLEEHGGDVVREFLREVERAGKRLELLPRPAARGIFEGDRLESHGRRRAR